MKKTIGIIIFCFALLLTGCEKNYEVGDYYSKDGVKGIVAAVDDLGEVSLLMSLDEVMDINADSALRWAENYEDGGWHLPTKEEMIVLKKYKSLMNITIERKKNVPFLVGHSFYWTSTPCSESHCYACGPDGIRCYFSTNSSPHYKARAVRGSMK